MKNILHKGTSDRERTIKFILSLLFNRAIIGHYCVYKLSEECQVTNALSTPYTEMTVVWGDSRKTHPRPRNTFSLVNLVPFCISDFVGTSCVCSYFCLDWFARRELTAFGAGWKDPRQVLAPRAPQTSPAPTPESSRATSISTRQTPEGGTTGWHLHSPMEQVRLESFSKG